ncbi:hypothetical protein EVAR_59668_1 [Eumeta japonica]|uniref:Uncharacterized protein n=1 Tax=Eumeta variegata TaxID=151549 RepID=A0A4C1Z4B7_EUMVA|nr:hypothetical protein EVAR_59668_1 [Eumeta japonica]
MAKTELIVSSYPSVVHMPQITGPTPATRELNTEFWTQTTPQTLCLGEHVKAVGSGLRHRIDDGGGVGSRPPVGGLAMVSLYLREQQFCNIILINIKAHFEKTIRICNKPPFICKALQGGTHRLRGGREGKVRARCHCIVKGERSQAAG